MPKRKLTKTERSCWSSVMFNAGAEVAYRLERFWAAQDEGLTNSIKRRREREYYKACEKLAEATTNRVSDGMLTFVGGQKAVEERDRLIGAGADVVPFKRRGQPRW